MVQLKRAVGPMGVGVGAAVMGVPAGAEPPLLALPEAGRCAVPCVKIAHPRHPLRTRYYLCLTVKNSSSEVYVSPPQVSLGLQVREPGFETEPVVAPGPAPPSPRVAWAAALYPRGFQVTGLLEERGAGDGSRLTFSLRGRLWA